MDVTCDRCKAEYEFDEALLGERGTTVKCSACGHVFRVLPPSRDAVRSHLQLRYARDGSVRALSSLRELQQRIRAGEVSLDDELGRDGFPFRALRDVPELKNFFLSQPGRQERSTVRPEGTYPRQDAASTHMPVHPESISPGPEHLPDEPGPEELGSENLESDQPEAPTIPPPLPGSPEREAADARRAAAAARAEHAVAEQRAANAGRTIPAPAGIPPEQRPRSFRQGTMSGVGPEGQLPPPPRMPEFGPRTRSEPVPATPAPTSPVANPHAGKLPPPGTGTVTGLPNMKPHQTLYGTPSGMPGSNGTPTHGMQPGSTHPLANRLGSERPPASERPPSGQTRLPSGQTKLPSGQTAIPRSGERAPVPPVDEVALPKPLVEPDRFPQFKPVPSPLPPAPGSKPPPRKLYLDADEKAPPRATEGSRAWLYVALLLLAAGGGGWFGMTRMRVSGKARLEPNPATMAGPSNKEAPIEAADAAVAEAEPTQAEQPADNAGPTGAAPFAPPIPELQEELARRTGEPAAKPEAMADKAKPSEAMAPPAKVEPTKPAKPEPVTKPEPAAKPEPVAKSEPAAKMEPVAKPGPAAKQPAAEGAGGAKNDRLARAERAVATNPKDYGAQLNLADALFAKGDNAAAVEAYKQALALRPTGSEANSGMGFALLKDGKASDSLPYFDRAASSGYAEASVGLGDAYRTLGQPSSAKEAYQAYLDRLPTGARATYARTWLDKLSGGGGKTPERAAEPEPYRPAGELTSPP
ncbi:MAG: zinc-ribbon domain-containing protein [Polyangiales bacterium]